ASSPPVVIPDSDVVVTPDADRRPGRRKGSGPRWPLFMAAVLVVVIVIALLQLVLPNSKTAGHHAATLPSPATAKTQPLVPTPSPTPPPLTFPVPAEGVTVRILLTSKPSWVSVYDERSVFLIQETVQPSLKALDLHAAGALNVTIGDASAAELSCNG